MRGDKRNIRRVPCERGRDAGDGMVHRQGHAGRVTKAGCSDASTYGGPGRTHLVPYPVQECQSRLGAPEGHFQRGREHQPGDLPRQRHHMCCEVPPALGLGHATRLRPKFLGNRAWVITGLGLSVSFRAGAHPRVVLSLQSRGAAPVQVRCAPCASGSWHRCMSPLSQLFTANVLPCPPAEG